MEAPSRVDCSGSRIHHVAVERNSGETRRGFGRRGAGAEAWWRCGQSRGLGREGALEA